MQNPLRLDDSEPIPDIAVVPGVPEDYLEIHPTTAMFVIEVSKTTQEYDHEQKLPLYAQASIPECWIVNLQEGMLEVYRKPVVGTRGTRGVRSPCRGASATRPTRSGQFYLGSTYTN